MKDFKNKIESVKLAQKQLHEANKHLEEYLLEDVSTLIKEKNIKGLNDLFNKLPDCFFKYKLFNEIENLEKK